MRLLIEAKSTFNSSWEESSVFSVKGLMQELASLRSAKKGFAVLENTDKGYLKAVRQKNTGFSFEYEDETGKVYQTQKNTYTQEDMVDLFAQYFEAEENWGQKYSWKALHSKSVNDNKSREKTPLKWNHFRFFGIMSVIVGIFLLGKGEFERATIMDQTSGEVVYLAENKSGKQGGSYTYAPVFQFSVGEQTYSVQSHISTSPPSYYVGEKVDIYYNRLDPKDAYINSMNEKYMIPLMMLLFGAVFYGIGHFLALRRRRFNLTQ